MLPWLYLSETVQILTMMKTFVLLHSSVYGGRYSLSNCVISHSYLSHVVKSSPTSVSNEKDVFNTCISVLYRIIAIESNNIQKLIISRNAL